MTFCKVVKTNEGGGTEYAVVCAKGDDLWLGAFAIGTEAQEYCDEVNKAAWEWAVDESRKEPWGERR